MKNNFISERTLRVLASNNESKIPEENISHSAWCSKLDREFQLDWKEIPEIPVSDNVDYVDGVKSYYFNYDKTRFNPYQIEKNLGNSISLLEECYSLKDKINLEEIEIINFKASNLLMDKLDKLELKLEDVKKYRNSNIAHANKLYVDKNAGHNIMKAAKKSDDDVEMEAKELILLNQQRELRQKERERLVNLYEGNLSVFNKKIKLSRLKAKYSHRINELVMLAEALKHGFLIVHNKLVKMDNNSISENVESLILMYQSGQESINRPFDKLFVNGADLDASKDETHFEIETPIREFLWETTRISQRINLKKQSFIKHVSLMNELGKEGVKELFTKGFISFDLEDQNGSLAVKKKSTIIGLNIEILIKADKKAKQLIKDKSYSIDYTYIGLTKKHTLVEIETPSEVNDIRNSISIHANSSIWENSSLLHASNIGTLFGEEIMKNKPVYGNWRIKLEKQPEKIDKIQDVVIAIHQNEYYV